MALIFSRFSDTPSRFFRRLGASRWSVTQKRQVGENPLKAPATG
jgi:hypothetical protein